MDDEFDMFDMMGGSLFDDDDDPDDYRGMRTAGHDASSGAGAKTDPGRAPAPPPPPPPPFAPAHSLLVAGSFPPQHSPVIRLCCRLCGSLCARSC